MVSRSSIAVAAALAYATLSLTAAAQVSQPAQPPTVTAPSAAANEAAKAVDAFHAALARGDTVAALALLAEDAMIFEEGNVERSKSEYAAHHAAADAAFSAAVPSTLLRRSAHATGDLAWIASETRTTGRYKERAVDRLGTESMVLRRDPDGWHVVHIHWSSRAAPS